MNKKTIKEFLRPDWKKIFLLIILFIILVFLTIPLRLSYDRLFDLIENKIIMIILIFLIETPANFLYGLLADDFVHYPRFYGLLIFSFGIFIWYFIICCITHFYDKFKTRDKESSEKTIKKMTMVTILLILIVTTAILVWQTPSKEFRVQKLSECQQLCVRDYSEKIYNSYRLKEIEKFSSWSFHNKEDCIHTCLDYRLKEYQILEFPLTSKVFQLFGLRKQI